MKKIHLRYILYYLLLMDIIYITRDYVYTLNNNQTMAWPINIFSNSTSMLLWIPLIYLLVFVLDKFPLVHKNKMKSILYLLPSILLISFIHRYLTVVFGKFLQYKFSFIDLENYERVKRYFTALIAGGSLSDFIFCFVLTVLYTFIRYYRKYTEEQKRNLKMSEDLANARLKALKQQIQPHFLFNTLNTVSAVMSDEVEKAQVLIAKLAHFLRSSLDFQEHQFVSLEEELSIIKSYLEIEKERFIDRLVVEYKISDTVLEAKLPSFLLQPFVENSIKHAVNKQSEVNRLTISAALVNKKLVLIIQNNGKFKLAKNFKLGIGLSNSKKRLETIYKENYRLNFEFDSGFKNIIQIPFEVLDARD